MTPNTNALEALWGAADARRYLERAWPGEPMVAHRAITELPEALRPELLLDPRQLGRVYRGSIQVTNGSSGQYALSGVEPSVYFDALGLAVRFTELGPYLPTAAPWLRAIERELGLAEGAAGLHAFVNAPGIGLGAHCDPSEHIAIQLVGTKRFRIAPNPHTRFTSVSHAATLPADRRTLAQSGAGLVDWHQLPADATEIELRPGSVLFLPRGTYHETAAGGEQAVTLVVQLAVPSFADWVAGYLRDYLAQDEPWRMPAAGAWSRDAARRDRAHTHVRGLLSELAEVLPGLDPGAMTKHAQAGAAARELDGGVGLLRDPAVVAEVEVAGDAASLRIGDGAHCVRLSADAAEVARWLTTARGRFTLAELEAAFDDWEPASLHTLASFFVDRGVLGVVAVEAFRRRVPPARG